MNLFPFNTPQTSQTQFTLSPYLQPGAKILFVSDGADEDWRATHTGKPFVSGVKRFSETIVNLLKQNGYQVNFLHPYILDEDGNRLLKTAPLPLYPDTEVASNLLQCFPIVQQAITENPPDAIFIATVEGPLGLLTSWLAKTLNIPYSLAFTTNFHEYIGKYINTYTNGRIDLPSDLPIYKRTYKKLYQDAKNIFVPTQTVKNYVHTFGIEQDRIILWPRGIDTHVFHPPQPKDSNPYHQYDWYRNNPLPILIYFGRISIDKRIDDFLNLPHPAIQNTLGTNVHKVIIGAGLQDETYQAQYADAHTHFLGSMNQSDLAQHLRWANMFLFPSVTDTFGNVILEAAASGVPVIGRIGPEIASSDVLLSVGGIGVEINPELLEKLKKSAEPIENYPDLYHQDQQKWLSAIQQARQIAPQQMVTNVTRHYSWEKAMYTLLENI